MKLIKEGNHMGIVAKRFQTVKLAFRSDLLLSRDIMFRSWKMLIVEQKTKNFIAKRQYLRILWRRWKMHMRCRKLQELEDYASMLDKRLATMRDLQAVIETNHLVSACINHLVYCLMCLPGPTAEYALHQ
jgi:hypothetical protein